MLLKISGPKKTSRRFSILHSEELFMPIIVQFRRLRCAGNEAGIGRQGMYFFLQFWRVKFLENADLADQEVDDKIH
jgi:hypothetical protein